MKLIKLPQDKILLTKQGDSEMNGKKSGRRSIKHPFLGDRVKYLRENTGKEQVDIEIAMGIKTGQGYLSRIESGKDGVELTKLQQLSAELSVEPEVLMYQDYLPENQVWILDKFFKLLKRKKPASVMNSIELLIQAGLEEPEDD